MNIQTCRNCGHTKDEWTYIVPKTGYPYYFLEDDLCPECIDIIYPEFNTSGPLHIKLKLPELKPFNGAFKRHLEAFKMNVILNTVLLLVALSSSLFAQVQVTNIPGRAYIYSDISPNQARSNALTDAKLNALKRAGIPENISSYQNLQTDQVQNKCEQQFNSHIQALLTGTVTNDSITAEKAVMDSAGQLVYEVWINATVQSREAANKAAPVIARPSEAISPQTFHYINGDTYSGQWLNGQRNGYGTYTWANGSQYVGYYKQGIRMGAGVWYGHSGKVLSGYWNNGQLIEYCVFNNNKNTTFARGTGANSQPKIGESAAEALKAAPTPQDKLIQDQNNFSQEVEAEQSKMQ